MIVELEQQYSCDKESISVPDLKLMTISSFCFAVSLLGKIKNILFPNFM